MYEYNEIELELAELHQVSDRLDIVRQNITIMEGIADIKEPNVYSRELAALIKENLNVVHGINMEFEYNPYQIEASMEGLGDVGRRVYKMMVEVARKIAGAFRRLLNLILRNNDSNTSKVNETKEKIVEVSESVDRAIDTEGLKEGEVLSDQTIEALRSRSLYVVVNDKNRVQGKRDIRNDVTLLCKDRNATLGKLGRFTHEHKFDPAGLFNRYAEIINSLADINAPAVIDNIYRYVTSINTVEDASKVSEKAGDPLQQLTIDLSKALGVEGKTNKLPTVGYDYKVVKFGHSKQLLQLKAKPTRNRKNAKVKSLHYGEFEDIAVAMADVNAAIKKASGVSDEIKALADNMDHDVLNAQHDKINKMANQMNKTHHQALNVLIYDFKNYIQVLAGMISTVVRDASEQCALMTAALDEIHKGADEKKKTKADK